MADFSTMRVEEKMKIGEIAKLTKTTQENIRFYEREGLLPAPERSSNNYRQYGREHVERLHLIRRLRMLGVSLDDIRSLLVWADGDAADSELLEQALQKHLMKAQERIDQLMQLKRHLLALREQRDPPPH
ncbi:MerR family transcriptional regulator [Achromobacter xylosoxidans]|uniref:MerR family transcriptional regulator n=1 Tax=Alcaligenes xylosoxydans xylosoxydans TaxID=85698 RepID=UPI001EED48E9|nr:MerR family transcriptional regulator [Achromobacter xylosoxidans]